MKLLSTLFVTAALALVAPLVSLAQTLQFGNLSVTQFNFNNTPTDIAVTLAPGSTPGITVRNDSTNRGDYALSFGNADDPATGIMISSVRQNSRDDSATGNTISIPFQATSATESDAGGYFISLFHASNGGEVNMDVSVGFFPFASYLGGIARNSANNTALNSIIASPGIALGTGLQFQNTATAGQYLLNLTGLGASSANGILLVTGGKNEDNFALSRPNADGTFSIWCKDNDANTTGYEADPVAFVYLPVSGVGANSLAALGRVNSNATTDLAAGAFTVTKGGTGTWFLTISGQTNATGTLLISPEWGGAAQGNMLDNILSAEWDAANLRWVIQSRDITNATTAPALQDGATGAEDVFSFAFFTTTGINQPPTVTLTAPLNNSNFAQGPLLLLEATAADTDGTIAKVEFFDGSTKLGEDTTAPYALSVSTTALGARSYTARATDSSGSIATSSVVSVTVQPPAGVGGLWFDGANDYVTFGNEPELGLDSFTLECWFRRDGAGITASSGSGGVAAVPLITKGRGESDGSDVDCNYLFGIQGSTGRLTADFEDSATGLNHPVLGTTVVPNGVWQHAAVTFDANTFEWRLYLNGGLEAVASTNGQLPRSDSIQHSAIGSALNSLGQPEGAFFGIIDEVRIWNTARTQAEIQQTINAQLPAAPGLIARWAMDEGAGATLTSTATTTITGNLINGPGWTTGAPFNANISPAVALTTPANGSAKISPATFALEASATDSDGSITQVEFLRDGVVIATDTTAPYSASETALGSGVYVYTVRATDNLGAVATSAPVTVTVNFDPLHPPSNTALRFDGVDDYVTMGIAPEFGLGGPPSNGLTIECWFRKEGAGVTSGSGSGGITGVPLFGKGRGESDGGTQDCDYFFGIDAAGHLVADFETYPAPGLTSGQNYPVTATNTPIANGTWYHAAATYDGASATWKLYLNGVQVGSAAAAAGARPRFDSAQHFGIATAMTTTGAREGAFAGRIDEVRVWNYARSAAEILAAKDLEISAAPGLVGRYGLNEAAGTTAGNSTTVTAAPIGTLGGNPTWVEGAPFSSSNPPPVVALTAPTTGSSTVYPAAFTLAATATDAGGSVARVEFYVNGAKVGEDATAPYTYAWTPPAVGTYAVIARAIDDLGAADTSAAVSLEVTPNPNQPPVIALNGPADNATGIGASTTLSIGITDPEGDGAEVTFYGRKTVPATPAPDFTVMVLPDTQYYSENTPSSRFAQFLAQTNWIVSQKDVRNVAFVSHMGDIVDDGDSIPQQWVNANQAMSILENHATVQRAYGLPFGASPGNHDQAINGDPNSPSSFYNQYFGVSRYAGRPYWGGNYGVNNDNNYQLFSAGGLDFIILHLEYRTSADPAVIAWADALLKAHPHRRAIVTSHWIIGQGNPAPFGGQGQQIYDGLKNNRNLFLLLCGHIHAEGRRTDTFEGRAVHSILSDYQGTSTGGSGFLRTLTFSPANNTITVESYSPTLGRAVNASDGIPGFGGTFTLPYNMQTSVSDWIPLGHTTVAAGGNTAALAWSGLEKSSNYEWYASVSDGINVAQGATHRFSTAAAVPPAVALTSPAASATIGLADPVVLKATATDADGTITRVDFFQGNTKVGEDTTAPYELTLPALPLGTYTFNATAIDDSKLASLSATATLTVVNHVNVAPTVALMAPLTGSTYLAPSDIALAATASDSDGTVAKVEFFNGATKLGEDLTAPYEFTLAAAPAGSYTLTAVATDDIGAQTTSAPVTVTVVPAYTSGVQTFNTMGTTTAAPAGWQVFGNMGGSNSTWTDATGIPASGVGVGTANATLIASTTFPPATASSNTQGYNFALAASPTDRALGSSPTTGAGIALQLTLTNTSVLNITAINVGYDIRRFTVGAAVNSLPGYRLFYSLDNGTTWTNVTALNPTIAGPTGVIVPNTTGVTTVPSTAITLSSPWAAGAGLRLRWVDDNAVESSPDQILGLDNVTVTSAAADPLIGTPPAVALTAPLNGATFDTPATIALAATATDSDGTVSKVEFYNGATKLGEDLTAPFTFDWNAVAVGSYTLTAAATDNNGNRTVSASVGVTVTVPAGSSGALLRGPYLNMPNDTSIVVRWRSSLSTIGRVRYGASPTTLTQVMDETSAKTDHEVRLTGLTPYTRYYYSVGSAVDTLTPELVDTTSLKPAGFPAPTAADYTFRTSPVPGTATDTRIWVVGDCGRGSAAQAGGRDAYYNFMGTHVPDFVLMLGDNAYNNGTDTEYQTGYFLMYPSIFRKMPQWSTMGNHDADNGSTSTTANFPYFDMFTFPMAGEAGGVPSGTEHYYSFDYGNVHVINLDSQTSSRNTIETNGADGPMAAWLRLDLASTTRPWIIVIFHHPEYTKGSHDSDTETQLVEMRQRFGPILDKGGADLVLTGHSHVYERSPLIDGHYGLSSTFASSMRRNSGNGSTTGFTVRTATGTIRRGPAFTAVANVNGTFIPPDGAYIKPLTGPRDHFGTVHVVDGSAGQADGGSLNHTAMYVSYNTVGTLNIDVSGNTLVATYVQSGNTTPDNFTIIKQGAADTDADGISDEYEIANGLNRTNPADVTPDLDGDGLANGLEYALGTPANSPANGAGLPTLGFGTGADAGKLTLTFARARADVIYTVQASDDLQTWTDVAIDPGSVGANVTVTDVGSVSPTRFLRLQTKVGAALFRTVPVGYMKFNVPGGGATTPLGISLDDPSAPTTGIRAGRIESFTVNTITNGAGGWTGNLAAAPAPWLLRITSGPSAGKTLEITANTTTSVTIGGADLTSLGLTAGTDTFELVPMDTLWTLLGSDTVQGGASAATADNVQVRSGASWLAYYYDTNLGFWRRTIGPATNSNNVLVRPGSGLQVVRRNAALPLTFTGRVAATPFRVAINNASSTAIHVGFPTNATLGSLALQTRLSGWRSGSTATEADLVALYNGTAWVNYFFNGTFWQPATGAATNSDALAIPAGAVIAIQRPGAASGTTDLVRVLPYSL